MDHPNRDALKTFNEHSLPDLDVVTLGALELLAEEDVPSFDYSLFKRPVVVGSGNAEITGRILFEKQDAVFADESSYETVMSSVRGIDGAVLISSSGSKHAVVLARDLHQTRKLPIRLLTNNPNAPAKEHLAPEDILVFPKNREPYTYNTSTYMGMILSYTKENTVAIRNFILSDTASRIRSDFADFDAFYLIVPSSYNTMREMFQTKFDELFGPYVSGRVFTLEQTKHAKTVIASEKELFISFGEEQDVFGGEGRRLHIPLPHHAGYGAMMAIGYYVIGHIQKQHPPYFKKNIVRYMEETSRVFGNTLKPIVE